MTFNNKPPPINVVTPTLPPVALTNNHFPYTSPILLSQPHLLINHNPSIITFTTFPNAYSSTIAPLSSPTPP
ncbi:hypothetical protein Syun_014411 [Stephania yunnanensis]|uniref:Uncharacterized protein n=1 Tax=Stephania yunnanensis TaxID=152371 RepID=A0AAP0JJ99_9MAGN